MILFVVLARGPLIAIPMKDRRNQVVIPSSPTIQEPLIHSM